MIRGRCFATRFGECVLDVSSATAPIRRAGTVVVAMAIAGPAAGLTARESPCAASHALVVRAAVSPNSAR